MTSARIDQGKYKNFKSSTRFECRAFANERVTYSRAEPYLPDTQLQVRAISPGTPSRAFQKTRTMKPLTMHYETFNETCPRERYGGQAHLINISFSACWRVNLEVSRLFILHFTFSFPYSILPGCGCKGGHGRCMSGVAVALLACRGLRTPTRIPASIP